MRDDPELAIALRYEPGGPDLPRIATKGRGTPAAQIVAFAEAHGMAARRDADLAALLDTFEVDSRIPLAAFAAVAEILAHLYRADQDLRERSRP